MFYIIEHFPKHTTVILDWFTAFLAAICYSTLWTSTCRDLKRVREKGNSSQWTFHHFYFSVNATLLSGNEVEEQALFLKPLFRRCVQGRYEIWGSALTQNSAALVSCVFGKWNPQDKL